MTKWINTSCDDVCPFYMNEYISNCQVNEKNGKIRCTHKGHKDCKNADVKWKMGDRDDITQIKLK